MLRFAFNCKQIDEIEYVRIKKDWKCWQKTAEIFILFENATNNSE